MRCKHWLTWASLHTGHCTAESGAETTLYIACHDVDEANAQAARELMAASKLDLPSNFVGPIVAALTHRYPDIRTAAAAALSAGIQVDSPFAWVIRIPKMCAAAMNLFSM